MTLIQQTNEETELSKLENLLWINTTHASIARYRTLVEEMERGIEKNGPIRSGRGRGGGSGGGRREDGPVALRKLLGRFRSFLAAEEKYWRDMVVRTVKLYELNEAKPTLTALSLNATDPDDLILQSEQNGDAEDSNYLPEPITSPFITPSIQAQKLAFVQRCLIQLGDLARYRELFNDKDGRPPAGKPQDHARHRGGRKVGAGQGSAPNLPPPSRTRNFTRAFDLYNQARLLIPSEGNPSNQLAILSMYSDDVFSAVFHYYRALCVERPFPTSRNNLESALKKFQSSAERDEGNDQGDKETIEVRGFKRAILELHHFWHNDIQ